VYCEKALDLTHEQGHRLPRQAARSGSNTGQEARRRNRPVRWKEALVGGFGGRDEIDGQVIWEPEPNPSG
jgi:hypothetical protein